MRREMQVVVAGIKEDRERVLLTLKRAGMEVYFLPTIRLVPQKLSLNSIAALRRISMYDYMFFTSAHAVTFFMQILKVHHINPPRKWPTIFAVGPTTAETCSAAGLKTYRVPKKFTSENMVGLLKYMTGKKILFPRSAAAPKIVVEKLRARGAQVSLVPLYTAEPLRITKTGLHRIFKQNIDCIVFKSGSSARSFSKSIPRGMLREKILGITALAIGPQTARVVSQIGFSRLVVAQTATTEGIRSALRRLQ